MTAELGGLSMWWVAVLKGDAFGSQVDGDGCDDELQPQLRDSQVCLWELS